MVGAVQRSLPYARCRRCPQEQASSRTAFRQGSTTASSRQGLRINAASTADSPAAEAAPTAASAPSILQWKEPTSAQVLATQFKLARALPWRRFKKDSILAIKLEGDIPEKRQPRISNSISMPALCESIRKAALDPRINGIALNIDLLGIGWAKAQEIRRYMAYFRESGKSTLAYMERGGEKEYYLATCCAEIYVPPTAQLSLRGLSVQGAFLRGILDKVGVEPQVKRIGKYKSAGDQLLRSDMSEPQREQLSALLDDIYDEFVSSVALGRGKTREEVIELLDSGVYDMHALERGGWVTACKYLDQVEEMLEQATGGKDDEVAAVNIKRYQHVNPGAFGLRGKKVIAVVRESGGITGGSKPQGGQIVGQPLIKKLRRLAEDKSIAGIVLRVDSPGGDALASDLMWREIKQVADKKPLVATMGDVAASGGYYMAMAAPTVVAHPLTITGSIGVVTGKFNFAELFERIGYSKEVISRGKYSELLQDYRSFNDVEQEYFDASAQFAYESFRDKAAASRGMEPLEMQEFAQGRVWSGTRAIDNRLIDHVGGMDTAIALLKEAAEIPEDEQVTLREVSMDTASPLALLSGGGASALGNRQELIRLLLTDPSFVFATLGFTVVPVVLQVALSYAFDQLTNGDFSADGTPQLTLDVIYQRLADGSLAASVHTALFPQAAMPPIDIKTSVDAATNLRDFLQ